MKAHWMIVLALLVFAVGCDQKQKAEDEARYAEQDAKVAEAVKKQKRGSMTKPEEGSGAAPADAGKDDAAKKSDDAETPESKDNTDETDSGESEEKTETSSKLNAKTVLDEAIAAAKADNKALFVHFTAQW